MKHVGILGGTFDPIHNGHIKLAANAYNQLNLDELWFMPAPNPPHKQGRQITDFEDRFNMIKLAIAGEGKDFCCSDFEKNRTGKSYTSDTLLKLKEQYPDNHFHFIMGADSLFEILTWHEPQIIFSIATLSVAKRDYNYSSENISVYADKLRKEYNASIELIDSECIDISSERIRAYIKAGKSIVKYVPKAVAEYIDLHKLYRG